MTSEKIEPETLWSSTLPNPKSISSDSTIKYGNNHLVEEIIWPIKLNFQYLKYIGIQAVWSQQLLCVGINTLVRTCNIWTKRERHQKKDMHQSFYKKNETRMCIKARQWLATIVVSINLHLVKAIQVEVTMTFQLRSWSLVNFLVPNFLLEYRV